MKRFEAYLPGDGWKAWLADDKTSISKKAGVVTIVTQRTKEDGAPFVLKTVFNLNVLPAYSFV